MKEQWPMGMKRTRQREDVFRVLVQAEEPLTAPEIYRRVMESTQDSGYAMSTIYRCLSAFEDKDLIEKTTLMGEDMAVYEWKRAQHKHYAVCLICRRKIPLKQCPMEKLPIHIAPEEFTVTGHKLELYGYCRVCREEKSVEII